MRRVFLFNPENDIALSHGKENFTPPKNAALLHRYGAPVMRWFGDEDDYVLVPRLTEEEEMSRRKWSDSMDERFGAGPKLVTSLAGLDIDSFVPWGWSLNACRQFIDAGAPRQLLEDKISQAETHRQLSHRRSSVTINRYLAETSIPGLPPAPVEATTLTDVADFASLHPRFYAKSPWSSSGRGVRNFDTSTPGEKERALHHCKGIIATQGSVMLEEELEKTADFAMLFTVADNEIKFTGHSLFFNSRDTAYGGNIIAGDDEIERVLSAFVPIGHLHSVRTAIADSLRFLPEQNYSGPVGIDMMVYRATDGTHHIAPCIEMNIRLTMGFLALALRRAAASLNGGEPTDRPLNMSVTPLLKGISNSPMDETLLLAPENPYFRFTLQ